MTTSSSDVAGEEPFFFTQADNDHESEEQTLQRKKQSRQDEWVVNEESLSLNTSDKDFKKVDRNRTSFFMIQRIGTNASRARR